METTFGRRKSQSRLGLMNGATKPPEAASTANNQHWPVSFKDKRHTVNWGVEALFNQKVIDCLGVLVLAVESRAKNHANANGILVNELNSLLGINHEALGCAIDIALVYIKVPASLFPANLDGRVHDEIRLVIRLAGSLALVLPSLLHGQDTEHNGLGAADGGCPHGVVAFANGSIEETGNHGDAAVLNVCRDWILFIVDKVLAEALNHELLGLLFHVGGDERCKT
jgi:hypothetical protein